MTSGVLTSQTVPVDWTIQGTEDSGLRQALYVQMQAAYDVVDQLGYQQAASLLTTQLMAEVNTLSKQFDGSAWEAARLPNGSVNYDDANAVTKALLVSGLTPSELGTTTHRAFYSGSTLLGTDKPEMNVFDTLYGFPMEYSTPGTVFNVFDEDSPTTLLDSFFIDSEGNKYRPISRMPPGTVVPGFDGATVPDTALPGDLLRSYTDGKYYLVNIKREAVEYGDAKSVPVLTTVSAEKSEVFSEKLSGAINELSKNGQIEAARMQQLVNLLQLLIGGASNTESRETRVKESILSKF